VADVPAQMDGLSRCPQEIRDDGGSRSFAVAAGNSDLRTGADLEKGLHLAGEDAAPLHSGSQGREIRAHPRGTEDHILCQIRQVIRPQPEAAAQSLQFLRRRAKG